MRTLDFEGVVSCAGNFGSSHEKMPDAGRFVDVRIETVTPDRIDEVLLAIQKKTNGSRLRGIDGEVPFADRIDPGCTKRCGGTLNLGPGV